MNQEPPLQNTLASVQLDLAPDLEMTLVRCHERTIALSLATITEIVQGRDILPARVPHCPAWHRGVFLDTIYVATLIDMARYLDPAAPLTPLSTGIVILMQAGMDRLGLLASQLAGNIVVPADALRPSDTSSSGLIDLPPDGERPAFTLLDGMTFARTVFSLLALER